MHYFNTIYRYNVTVKHKLKWFIYFAGPYHVYFKFRSPSKRFARQTVPQMTREVLSSWEKKISKPIARVNGTSSSHIRPYDSFNHKIQVSEPDYRPRKAWAETPR